MYQFSSADIQNDSIADAKDRERQVLDRAIELLVEAQKTGVDSFKSIEAIHFVHRVWTTFLDDLSNPENQLPKELRANLISIGMWVLRESEAIRQGTSNNFDGLIEVSQIIRDGLR
jgi:flagellar protein FlaF